MLTLLVTDSSQLKNSFLTLELPTKWSTKYSSKLGYKKQKIFMIQYRIRKFLFIIQVSKNTQLPNYKISKK